MIAPPDSAPLLEISDLAVSFRSADGGGDVQAVAGASLTIHPGQTLAVVGESGCGKSVTAMSVLRLLPRPPAHFDRGTIRFGGRDLLAMPERELLAVRGREIAMIFQEPMTSLNPVYTVGDQIVEAVLLHQPVDPATAREIAVQALRDVGVEEPQRRVDDYPHEFSGGMRQRVMIAMALACQPKLLLADEPTTALDVTIQAQILALLAELRRTRGMAIMLITHNLGVVAQNADVACVMYGGRVVEYATVPELFAAPLHPYTRGLFSSIPSLGVRRQRLTTVDEVVRDPAEFTKLPDAAKGVVPWWPGQPRPAGVAAPALAGRDSVLHEVAPGHWVGCWRTAFLEGLPRRQPDLTFRRGAAAIGE